jgi:hypothetical protein
MHETGGGIHEIPWLLKIPDSWAWDTENSCLFSRLHLMGFILSRDCSCWVGNHNSPEGKGE